MSKLKSRVEEILDGITDPATLEAVRKVQAILSASADTEAIDRLEELTERVERLERAGVFATEDPRPQRDTSWHPYDASKLDYSPGYYPNWDETVVVMLRGSDEIQRPAQAVDWDWAECGDDTIIAWRYAKEGE